MLPDTAMIERIGAATRQRLQHAAYGLALFFSILKEVFSVTARRSPGGRVLTMQILFTGVEALSIVAIASLAIGAVIVVQGLSLLPQFGQGQVMYPILVAVIMRELGPILTALIVTARSGTAITTELGNMVLHHEVEAYIASGIQPIAYLAVPRFLGVTISLFLLNIYFNIFGLIGSYFVTQFLQPIGFSQYFGNLLASIGITDIASSLVKSLVFGAIVSTVAIYHGFAVEQSVTELPQRTIKSVGQSLMLLIVANVLISALYYL
jgi:phospholipid/cholesterol/gamma-HCH transport system permease protein